MLSLNRHGRADVDIATMRDLTSAERAARTIYANLRKRTAAAELYKRKQLAPFNSLLQQTSATKRIKRNNYDDYGYTIIQNDDTQKKTTFLQNIDEIRKNDDAEKVHDDNSNNYREQSVSFLTGMETRYESMTAREPLIRRFYKKNLPLQLSVLSEAKKLKRKGDVSSFQHYTKYLDETNEIINIPHRGERTSFRFLSFHNDNTQKSETTVKYFTNDSISVSRLEPILTNTNLKIASVVKERLHSPVVKTSRSNVQHRKLFLNPIFHTPK